MISIKLEVDFQVGQLRSLGPLFEDLIFLIFSFSSFSLCSLVSLELRFPKFKLVIDIAGR